MISSETIRKRLLQMDWTPTRLAVEMNRSVATIYNILAGKKVSPQTLYDLHKVLKIKPRRRTKKIKRMHRLDS